MESQPTLKLITRTCCDDAFLRNSTPNVGWGRQLPILRIIRARQRIKHLLLVLTSMVRMLAKLLFPFALSVCYRPTVRITGGRLFARPVHAVVRCFDPLLPAQECNRTIDLCGILYFTKRPFKIPMIPPPNEFKFPSMLDDLQEFLREHHSIDASF
jgi:hypothetical protein